MPVSASLSDSRRVDLTSMGTVVVVEDPLVSKLVRAVLQRHGYEVKLADRREAAALLAGSDTNIDVLITNEPADFLEYSDWVPLLYLSSAPDVTLEAAFRFCRVVVKPFVPEELVRAVNALIGA